MPELVLSNTATFFTGSVEALFKKAKKYGFRYLEIVPYRWTKASELLRLEKKYEIKVAGIHLPNTSWQDSLMSELKETPGLLNKLFTVVFRFYLGNALQNPGLKLAAALDQPYVLCHSDIVHQMAEQFRPLSERFSIVIENIPYEFGPEPKFWNPVEIKNYLLQNNLAAGLVFDPGHFGETLQQLPYLNLLEVYGQSRPDIIHISYNSRGIHLLPDAKEQEELKQMLQIHQPKYLVLETNPLVSVAKGKRLLENLIHEALA